MTLSKKDDKYIECFNMIILVLLVILLGFMLFKSMSMETECIKNLQVYENKTFNDVYNLVGCKCMTNCISSCKWECVGER